MTVYGCSHCRVVLTMRPSSAREHIYSFPYSDDYRGCDTCGGLICEACASEVGERCPVCRGLLHPNRQFKPTGEYRLPPPLRRLGTPEERIAWVIRMYERGIYVSGERDYFLRVIEETADDRSDA